MTFWTAPQALRDLAFYYARAIDTRDASMLASVFTADGVLGGHGSAAVRYTGLEGWQRMIAEVAASFGETMHNVFNQTFDRSEDGAVSGLTTGTASHILPGGGDLVDFAMRYHDRYAQEGGRWKFSERRLEVVWVEQRRVSKFSADGMGRILKGF